MWCAKSYARERLKLYISYRKMEWCHPWMRTETILSTNLCLCLCPMIVLHLVFNWFVANSSRKFYTGWYCIWTNKMYIICLHFPMLRVEQYSMMWNRKPTSVHGVQCTCVWVCLYVCVCSCVCVRCEIWGSDFGLSIALGNVLSRGANSPIEKEKTHL